jgi:hypothetical protein
MVFTAGEVQVTSKEVDHQTAEPAESAGRCFLSDG